MKQVSIFILAILLSKTVIAQTDQGINDNWLFKKLNFSSQPFKTIQLPHTFNAFDADDGGGSIIAALPCIRGIFRVLAREMNCCLLNLVAQH